MAIKQVKTNTELNALFTDLAEPFDPTEIKWRVTHTTRDGSRGAVIAYADPRAYTDRLNQLFTPTGWTRTYEVSTISAVARMKKDKLIQTGKVLVTCTLTITGLGCHAGSGEDWADEANAMTTAEAQAFKRAASCYGLGRYLYNLAEMWVPLNEHRQPFEFPSLPQWALPKASAAGKSHPASGPHPTPVQRGPIDQRITGKIEGFRRILGVPIFGEILWRVARTRKANAIPNAQLQANVAEAMERAARGIGKAHSLAELIGDTQFVSVLDRLHIGSMTTISNLEALRHLVSELEALAGEPAASSPRSCEVHLSSLRGGMAHMMQMIRRVPELVSAPPLRAVCLDNCKNDACAATHLHDGGVDAPKELCMEAAEWRPQTFIDWVLALLEERFPWLGSERDEPVGGADIVDELDDLYKSLIEQRDIVNREDGDTQT